MDRCSSSCGAPARARRREVSWGAPNEGTRLLADGRAPLREGRAGEQRASHRAGSRGEPSWKSSRSVRKISKPRWPRLRLVTPQARMDGDGIRRARGHGPPGVRRKASARVAAAAPTSRPGRSESEAQRSTSRSRARLRPPHDRSLCCNRVCRRRRDRRAATEGRERRRMGASCRASDSVRR